MFIPLSERFIQTTRLGRFIGKMSQIGSIIGAPIFAGGAMIEHQAQKALLEPTLLTVHIPNQQLPDIIAASCRQQGKRWYEFIHLKLQHKDLRVSAPLPCFRAKIAEEAERKAALHIER